MAFEQLMDIIDLIITMSPFLFLLILIMTALTAAKVFREMAIFITIGIIFSLLIYSIPVYSAENHIENIEDMNKNQFDYMDINTFYFIHDSHDGLTMDDRYYTETIHNSLYLDSYGQSINDKWKNQHTIFFDENLNYTTLNIMSKFWYNFSSDAEIEINIYYISNDNADRTFNIPVIYSDYADRNYPGNSTYDYYYINGGKQYLDDDTQYSGQRFSNIEVNTIPFRLYEILPKDYTVDSTLNEFQVNNRYYNDSNTHRLKTNQWNTLRIYPQKFYQDGYILDSHKFMNIGLEKINSDDIIIIDSIIVKEQSSRNGISIRPFLEYYEFNDVYENNGVFEDRTILNIDFFKDDYEFMQCYNFSLSMYNSQLLVYYDANLIFTSKTFITRNTSQDFRGYQIYIQKNYNENTNERYYTIYLYVKYDNNIRHTDKSITYNYQYILIKIENDISYMGGMEYRDNFNSTDARQNYIINSQKWDVIDKEIVKIDLNVPADTSYTVSNEGGLAIPGVKQLRNLFQNIIVFPLSSLLKSLASQLKKPLESLISSFEGLSTIIDSISSQLSSLQSAISDQLSSIISGLSLVETAIGNIQGWLTTLQSAITGKLDFVITGITEVISAVNDVYGEAQLIVGELSSILSNIISIVTDITQLLGYFVGPEGIPALINGIFDFIDIMALISDLIIDIVPDFIAGISGFLPDVLNYLISMAFLITDYLELALNLIGALILIRIMLSLLKFNQTEDIADLYDVLEAIGEIAYVIVRIANSVIQFIGGIIP